MPNPSTMTLQQAFDVAFAHHQAGRLVEAEDLYRQIVAIAPGFADGWHLWGCVACQMEKNEAAIELIEKAVALNPRHAVYRSNLGEANRKAGRKDQAEAEFRKAVGLDPAFADAYVNWGRMLINEARIEEALQVFETAVRHMPQHAMSRKHIGDCMAHLGRVEAAISAYREAVKLDPALVEAHFNLGALLVAHGLPTEAERAFRAVIAMTPGDVKARMQLVEALTRQNKIADVLRECQAVLQLDPKNGEAYGAMAVALRSTDRIDDAIATFRKAIALAPEDRAIQANLALALRDQTRFDEAIALLRELVDKHSDWAAIHSGLIFTMMAHPRLTDDEIAVEEKRWNERFVAPFAAQRLPHSNDPAPERRLRIGYVSANLNAHPVGLFMSPLLKNHDRKQVEVFCYSTTISPDGFTATMEKLADHWRNISATSDPDAAAIIRADGIDILIDLGMHTVHNRLTLFALKPAPVQITYLAYCAGTGLQTIDYRLTDPHVDPMGAADADRPFERPLRLAETYWCYAPHSAAAEVGPLPALEPEETEGKRGVTFGSFNYFTKVNDDVLALWARLLGELPTARLMLHVPLGSRHEYVRKFFEARGVNGQRLELIPRTSERGYFELYRRVDIALDPFPFAGGTTTRDALWMGVPVITLAGKRTVSDGGASILSNVGGGIETCIANSPEQYVQKAMAVAADLGRLNEWRKTLRDRMKNSVLMDQPRFARAIEEAYRTAWRRWCEEHSHPSAGNA